ncbi:hypothetical protein DERP_006352 [Dermatophagoides pteronyssinus]|uniref:Uncharacterized protein n=1 Tax=Dermatophagoides pteronyssinus TaxID=6956 RepID=A0ABQ8IY74_DERPT|nr:hypothetical protein DERP_006352 [Dermatophagoides pteronyssinus]
MLLKVSSLKFGFEADLLKLIPLFACKNFRVSVSLIILIFAIQNINEFIWMLKMKAREINSQHKTISIIEDICIYKMKE